MKGIYSGPQDPSEDEQQEFIKEFKDTLEGYDLRMENVVVNLETGDISFDALDFPEHDTVVTKALLTFARNLEHTIHRKVEFEVSVPDYGKNGHNFNVVSDEFNHQ